MMRRTPLPSLQWILCRASCRASLTLSGSSPPPAATKPISLAWTASRSSVRSTTLVTYSSPRSRQATRPTFTSGVGLPPAIWLHRDQIFCLAPSINPLMLPVVSRQKTTSTRGLAFLAVDLGLADVGRTRANRAARPTSKAMPSQFRLRMFRFLQGMGEESRRSETRQAGENWSPVRERGYNINEWRSPQEFRTQSGRLRQHGSGISDANHTVATHTSSTRRRD